MLPKHSENKRTGKQRVIDDIRGRMRKVFLKKERGKGFIKTEKKKKTTRQRAKSEPREN